MQIDRHALATFLDEALGVLPEEHRVNNRPYWDYYNIANYILIHIFGMDWVETNVHPIDRPSRYFGRSRSHEERDRYRVRVCQLAELVHNLDRVENFDLRIEAINNAKQDGIEAEIVGLIAGSMLKRRGVLFRFVKETGTKQLDYDIEYVRLDGKVGHCETKCKLPATALTKSTVVNTLKTAKDQLPKGKSGIALRTPQDWHPSGDQETWKLLEAGINGFFEAEKTSRVSAVVGFTDVISHDAGGFAYFLVVRDYPNRFCQEPTGLPLCPSQHRVDDKTWASLASELAAAEPYRKKG
jgi:hypothetical protein